MFNRIKKCIFGWSRKYDPNSDNCDCDIVMKTMFEEKSDVSGNKIFKLFVNKHDLIKAKICGLNMALIDERIKSNKISDKLLALEMIVRKIEDNYPKQKQVKK